MDAVRGEHWRLLGQRGGRTGLHPASSEAPSERSLLPLLGAWRILSGDSERGPEWAPPKSRNWLFG